VPVTRPVGHDADDLGEVQLRVESVELAGGDERQDVSGGTGVVVGAIEQPCSTTDGDSSQFALGGIVLHAEPAVVEKAPERLLVANGVSESGCDEPALGTLVVLGPRPGEEGID